MEELAPICKNEHLMVWDKAKFRYEEGGIRVGSPTFRPGFALNVMIFHLRQAQASNSSLLYVS